VGCILSPLCGWISGAVLAFRFCGFCLLLRFEAAGCGPWIAGSFIFRNPVLRFARPNLLPKSDQLLQIDVIRSTSPPCLAKIRRDEDGAPVGLFVGLFQWCGAFVMPGICLLAWVEYHVGSI
jgi:hypothetical protein